MIRLLPMTITRRLSKLISQTLIGVMLFTQIAVASYACPSLIGMKAMVDDGSMSARSEAAAHAQDSMDKSAAMSPGCDQIDQDAANLCAEHCHFGQQSSDTAPMPMVLAPVAALLYSFPLEPESLSGSARSFPASDAVLAAPPPPHTILHCVYRI